MFVLDMVHKNYPKRRFKIGLNGLIPPSGEGNAKGQGLPAFWATQKHLNWGPLRNHLTYDYIMILYVSDNHIIYYLIYNIADL